MDWFGHGLALKLARRLIEASGNEQTKIYGHFTSFVLAHV